MRYHRVITSLILMLVLLVIYPLTHAGGGRAVLADERVGGTFGTDYRIGPRETKIETFTWTVPDDVDFGMVVVSAELNYRWLVKSVADYLKVPADEAEIIRVYDAETSFEVVDY